MITGRGKMSGDQELHEVSAVHGVITDTLEKASGDGHLNGDGEIDMASAVGLEDRLNELLVEIVEKEIHVVDGLGDWKIEIRIGLERMFEETLCLLSHSSDQTTQFRVQFVSVDSTRHFANVHHQISRSFEISRHLHDRHRMPKFAGDRSVKSHERDATLFEHHRSHVELVVGQDLIFGTLQILIQENLGRPRNTFDQVGTDAEHLGPKIGKFLVSETVHWGPSSNT